jgi:predicted CXXCH cytochrome family protein
VVAGFLAEGHPLRGRKDPNRPRRTFGCLSCHMPHTSDNINLFRYKANSMFGLCSYCHEM